MTFEYGREIQVPDAARRLEYLMATDDAYCSSSVGGNTRKYHGLLVDNNRVYLAALDEKVNGKRISVQQYAGGSDNGGLRHLHTFSLYPPRWVFFVGDAVICKTITFNGGVTVTYDVSGDLDLSIRPLITDRPVHEVLRDPQIPFVAGHYGVRWGGVVLEGDLAFEHDPVSYWNIWYEREQERGYAPEEDLFSPGFFHGQVKDSTVALQCIKNDLATDRMPSVCNPQTPLEWLEWASNTFCHGDEIYAGYHWFRESWGRDSAISVTGLLIERGKKDEAQAVLHRLATGLKDGMIPNRLPGNYHSSDAPLWFIHALTRYRRLWGDDRFMDAMCPVIGEILQVYPSSPVASLDGSLISVAQKSTWMDTAFTPREGKPVEINALWVHALMEAEAMDIETPVKPDAALAAFQQFWNEEGQYLYDLIDPIDSSVRPNQVIALALGLIEPDRTAAALRTIQKALMTPYGLRTLSPTDPRYCGQFSGDPSYHNGCVWPWLTGWYVDALIRNGVPCQRIALMLDPILCHIREAGAGYISEIFDGDLPHLPRGCIAQAWSVAEIARACRMVFT